LIFFKGVLAREILSNCFPVTRFFSGKRVGGNTPPTFV
jgi:hypothetical protein